MTLPARSVSFSPRLERIRIFKKDEPVCNVKLKPFALSIAALPLSNPLLHPPTFFARPSVNGLFSKRRKIISTCFNHDDSRPQLFQSKVQCGITTRNYYQNNRNKFCTYSPRENTLPISTTPVHKLSLFTRLKRFFFSCILNCGDCDDNHREISHKFRR